MKYLKVNESSGSNEGIVELVLSDTFLSTKPANLHQSVTDLADYLSRPAYTVVTNGVPSQIINPILYDWTLEFWIKCKFDPENTEEKPIFDYLVYNTSIDDNGVVTTDTDVTSIMRLYSSPNDNHNYVFEIHGQKKIIYRSVLDNRWNHIAVVHAGATSVIAYVNGNPIVGKNTDQINLTYKFDRIKFNLYEDSNKVYIANINVSDAPRYNKYFNPFTSLSPTTYGLGTTEESIVTIRELETSHSKTADTNQIYFPFQSFDLEDKGKLALTWTPEFSLANVRLNSNEDATNQIVDASELSYYNANDVDYTLNYGRRFAITTKNTGYYCLKSVQTIELDKQFPEFTMDCFFKINYGQGNTIIGDISILRDESTTTTQGLNYYATIKESGQTFIGSSLFAFKTLPGANFEYGKLYHYAMTYSNGIMKHYLDGKLILQEAKTISNRKSNLMLGTVAVFQTRPVVIHTTSMYLSHFRLNSSVLWETDFDPAQELFVEDVDKLPDDIKNSKNEKTAPQENTALLYPSANINALYDRGYNNTDEYKFNPEYDSTVAIKSDTSVLEKETAPKKWKGYPVLTSTTYSDRYNYIKFLANRPVIGPYTVEFWVYVEMKEPDSSYRNLAYFSGRDSFFGVQINGYGLLSLVYSKMNRYSTNFDVRKNSDSHEQIFTTSYTDQWIHIAFTHDVITSDGVNGLYSLSFYANGRLLESFTDWPDNSLTRLFLTTGDMDANIVPYYTGLRVTTDVKYIGEEFEYEEQ